FFLLSFRPPFHFHFASAFRLFNLRHSHARQTPWSVFQDGSMRLLCRPRVMSALLSVVSTVSHGASHLKRMQTVGNDSRVSDRSAPICCFCSRLLASPRRRRQ